MVRAALFGCPIPNKKFVIELFLTGGEKQFSPPKLLCVDDGCFGCWLPLCQFIIKFIGRKNRNEKA